MNATALRNVSWPTVPPPAGLEVVMVIQTTGSGRLVRDDSAVRRLPDRVVERLSAYRRQLRQRRTEGVVRIYSHELAGLLGLTAAQVRRDLMTIGHTGSPARGYDIAALIEHIDGLLDPGLEDGVVLVGVGRLGRAILDYFVRKHPEHHLVAAFDTDLEKVGHVLQGCRCHRLEEIEQVAAREHVTVGVVAVPAEAAQDVANRLISVGITGLLNFAPVRLQVPPGVFVENVDIALLLEKVSFFARRPTGNGESHA